MAFARKLADRVVFLHQGKVLFFGTMEEMERSSEPLLQEFLAMDELARCYQLDGSDRQVGMDFEDWICKISKINRLRAACSELDNSCHDWKAQRMLSGTKQDVSV